MEDKKFLKKLENKNPIVDGYIILNRLYGNEMPEPLRLFKFHFKHCQRSLNKQKRELISEFIPYLEGFKFKFKDLFSILIPFAGQIELLYKLIKAYNINYIEFYIYCFEIVEIGDKKKKNFYKEKRKVLYDCLSPPSNEEKEIIRKMQKPRIWYLIFISIVHVIIFSFLLSR